MSPWFSLSSILLGLWLIALPLTYSTHNLNDLICGILLILFGIFFKSVKNPLISWGYAFFGLWLNFAPLLFWAPNRITYLNDTIVGLLLIAMFLRMPSIPHATEDIGPSVPPGWSYNPSAWSQRLPIALLAFIGWMISRYLDAYQQGYISSVWDPFFYKGTLKVITSSVAKDFPVPDAGLGAFAYSLEFLSTFKGGERRWRTMPWMVILFGILAVPLSLVSVTLIILQPLVVGAWCTLCLTTAFLMLILVALSIDEVAAVIQYLWTSKEKPFLQLLIFGGKCPEATEDTKTPKLTDPWKKILSGIRLGITIPWNIALCVPCGAFFMFLPSLLNFSGIIADLNHVFGAFIIVASMVSLAEITRIARWFNLLFAFVIAISSIIYGVEILWHLLSAGLVAVLSIRKGPIKTLKSTILSKY